MATFMWAFLLALLAVPLGKKLLVSVLPEWLAFIISLVFMYVIVKYFTVLAFGRRVWDHVIGNLIATAVTGIVAATSGIVVAVVKGGRALWRNARARNARGR